MRFDLRFRPGVVRARRLELGWSQAELAEAAGVSAAAVKAWEQGRRTPTPPLLRRLADALGVPVDRIGGAGGLDVAGLRRSVGLTEQQAAEALGVSRRVLTRVESGVLLPPDPHRMAALYGVGLHQLAVAWSARPGV